MVRLARRLILWVGVGLAGVLLLLIAAAVIATWVIDPDRYKSGIAQTVQEQTGRALTLEGELQWRVFPWLVVSAGAGSLGNPAGFANGEFARWQSLRLGVKLLPLLHRQIIVDSVRATGLAVHLQRTAQGLVNWSFQSAGRATGVATPLQVDEFALQGATLSYDDERSGRAVQVTELNLQGRLPMGSTTQDLSIEHIQLSAQVRSSLLGEASSKLGIAAEQIHYAADVLSVPNWQGSFGPARFSGETQATLRATPAVRGSFTLQTDSLRELLIATGNVPPRTRDVKALGRFEIAARIEHDAAGTRLTALQARIDDTSLQGTVSLVTPRLLIDVQADRVELDRYLEPDDALSKPLELPLAQLKSLQVQGEVHVQEASIGGAVLKNARLRLVSP